MENVIVILILAAIAGAAVLYIVRAKRRGEKCIGCSCSRQCGGQCGCGSGKPDKGQSRK